jgi:hypothetical protein
MALLCNGRMYVGAGVTSFGGTAYLSTFPHSLPSNFTNRIRNLTAGQGITDDKVGLPLGYIQKGWMMPQKSGSISARMYDVAITTSANGLMGLPATGTATFTINTNTPAGELIVSGIGESSFALTTNSPLLTASLLAVGSTTFALTTNTPTIGAEANLTATASFTFTGSLTAYGVGHMEGNALPYTELSPQSLANAVWTYAIEAGYTSEEIIRILAAHAAGAATGLEGANPQFTGIDGTTLRIDGTYSAGTRTIDALNGA